MNGLTLDTGALIAIERSPRSRVEQRVTRVVQAALARELTITVPSVVLVEWWRGQRGPAANILDGIIVEPRDATLARIAGEALAKVKRGPSAVDAVVTASAARRGDVVYTSDPSDLNALRAVFPAVRVIPV